jgi:DNA-binding Xre family transcriptional regulator
MKTDVTYTWQLPVVMARAGYRTSTDLIEPLADRGIMLSRSQIYRLTRDPERVSLQLLAALCDIFNIGMNELITVESQRIRATKRRTVNDDAPPLLETYRPIRARIVPDPDDE